MIKKSRRISYIYLSILLLIISFFLFLKSINNYEQDIVNYKEKSIIDYKVYLKENNYFDTNYLGEGKAYITNLIDYIDIDFIYDLNLDNKKNGKYVYYINGIMSANVSNTNKDYWSKTYELVKLKEVKYDNTNKLNFKENIKLDYQTYNNLLLKFKDEYKLSIDGVFKVILCVENYIESIDGYELKKITTTSLEIPLTKSTIEVPIKLEEVNNKSQLISDIVYNHKTLNNIYKIISMILFLLGTYLLSFNIFKFVRSFEKISLYNKELKKILKTYDGIIVNVNLLPKYKNKNIIEVNSFNELLDAHVEIRQPISYYEEHKKAIFMLINGDFIWRYILKDNEYEE